MSKKNISCEIKTAGARANDLTTLICQFSRNSGNLNLLETLGPVQASNEIALPY